MENNLLDFDVAKSVGSFFRLNKTQMDQTIAEVLDSVRQWKKIAHNIGISRTERELMRGAFIV